VNKAAIFGLGAGAAGTIITIGVVLFMVVISPSYAIIPEPGTYDIEQNGHRSIFPTEEGDHSLDLTIDGARVTSLTLENLDVGKDGLTNVLEISGTGDTQIESLTIDGLRCGTLTLSDIAAHRLIYTDNDADGNSFAPQLGVPAPDDVTVSSSRGAGSISAVGNSYDKIVVQGGASGGIIKDFTITDVRTFGGDCVLSDMEIGTLQMTNMVVGTGDGINTPDFLIEATVTYQFQTGDRNTESAINVQ